MLSDNCVTVVYPATLANVCESPSERDNMIGTTNCVGLHLDPGLVFLTRTRISAGVYDISVFRKMLTWATPRELVIALLAAGNLATTQAATSLLDEHPKSLPGCSPSLRAAPSMFQVARAVGNTLHDMKVAPQDWFPT